MPLDAALAVLTIACMLLCVQAIILTVEIAGLRRDVRTLLHVTSELNHAVNPWAGENDPTLPDLQHSPPRLRRRARWSMFFAPFRDKRDKRKRRQPE